MIDELIHPIKSPNFDDDFCAACHRDGRQLSEFLSREYGVSFPPSTSHLSLPSLVLCVVSFVILRRELLYVTTLPAQSCCELVVGVHWGCHDRVVVMCYMAWGSVLFWNGGCGMI